MDTQSRKTPGIMTKQSTCDQYLKFLPSTTVTLKRGKQSLNAELSMLMSCFCQVSPTAVKANFFSIYPLCITRIVKRLQGGGQENVCL